jgi:hypothetical protein
MQDQATDSALATEGYFFSSEPFLSQPYIEAIQLACLLGSDSAERDEVILEVRAVDNDTTYQLALSGRLRIQDQHQHPVDHDQLRQLPLDQLNEQQLERMGWIISEKPRFIWLKQLQPLNQGYSRICSCALEQLAQLKELLQGQQPLQPA